MSGLTFLPWLRRGLAATLTTRDTGQATIARDAPLDVWVDVDATRAHGQVRLRPVDHVTGLDLTQVARRYPAPGAQQVETDFWPLIEFITPDLPWAMTPLAPHGSSGRLRPWLVLVCVPAADATFAASGGTDPATLTVAADLLPDLADSTLWAHVQSTVPAGSVAAAAGSTAVRSRLLAPVDLEPTTDYRVALVPALVPLGDDQLGRSWTAGAGLVTLPVFDTWTFTTGVASSFADLVRLLGPVPATLGLDLGLRAVDVTDLGAIDPWPDEDRVLVDYAGALVDTDLDPAKLGELSRAFNVAVTELLDQGDVRVSSSLDDPDPVVTPPLYGAYATDSHVVPPRAGWQRTLNLMPRHRMAAGLGAEVVRANQERYMAQAWAQAGELHEARQALNAGRLQAEIGRTWRSRADGLDDAQHAGILRAQYTTVRSEGGVAARGALRSSGIPNGIFDPAMVRVVRPSGRLARTIARRTDDGAPGSRATPLGFIGDHFGDPDARARMRFGVADAPHGSRMIANRLYSDNDWIEGVPAPTRGTAASRFTSDHPDDLALASVRARAATQIVPMAAGRARVQARIPGLAGLLAAQGWPDDEIPVRVKLGPRIDEALVWSLIDTSAELLMPGAGEFPDNAVRVVRANASFVAAFLAGANHEMTRELLWREYPADPGSTTFHRFWDRPAGDVDVDAMSGWPAGDTLAQVATGGGESVVVLARGDVFRLYPSLQVLLRDPQGRLAPPVFGGRIPPATRFFAFDVAAVDELLDDDWRIVFQEPPTEGRFCIPDGAGADTTNAATFAADTYRPPFREEFPVVDIVGEGGR